MLVWRESTTTVLLLPWVMTTRLLPKRLLMHPRKRSAWDRAHGRLPADAPLVETPGRNLPPVEYRDNPHYYSPKL